MRVSKLKNITLISDYIDTRMAEVDKYNQDNEIDKSLLYKWSKYH
jgi:miniconductance mechanosensitive channel